MNLSLDLIVQAAEKAGEEILKIYSSDLDVETKTDGSPLTLADLKSELIIKEILGREYPEIFILSEESVDVSPGYLESFFLVDPLDGTKEFLSKNGEFTVNISLIVKGKPVMGVINAPALGCMYFSQEGVGAWKKTSQGVSVLSPSNNNSLDAPRILVSRSHSTLEQETLAQAIGENLSVTSIGSSLKFSRLGEGFADIYLRMGPTSQWDTAAGHCLLNVLGGGVFDLDGKSLLYGTEKSLINPSFVAVRRLGLFAKYFS